MMCCYFNARVGSDQLDSSNAEWNGVRGNHGVGNVNEAGRTLLTFCAVNALTVINTLYEKRDIDSTSTHGNIRVARCGTALIMF